MPVWDDTLGGLTGHSPAVQLSLANTVSLMTTSYASLSATITAASAVTLTR